jgi:mannobiose 2-epimerase
MNITTLSEELKRELTEGILPFWMNRMVDHEHGGFYGRITGEDLLMPEADKGAVLNARILWTFSAAYRLLGSQAYLDTAHRAYRELIDRFFDVQYGGIYWSLHSDGSPADTRKQIYALAFAIYGLSEYHRATGSEEALKYAIDLFETIEQYSFDPLNNGYMEAFNRDWSLPDDMRLSRKDDNAPKTMNTHLHVLEAYTNLYRVWQSDFLKQQLRNLILLFVERIVEVQSGHLLLFFDEYWISTHPIYSYGHDIEASWLLHEAALVLGDEALTERVVPVVKHIAVAADRGLNRKGGLSYESFPETGMTDTDCHWWVQAENVVGHINLYQHFGNEASLHTAIRTWSFIKTHLIDNHHGEWHWSVRADGSVNLADDKAGFWKCPYHNGRMCMEVMERAASL